MRESINIIQAEDWISDLVGALTDPIICHGNELDAPPEKIRTAITLQRLIENMAAQRENRNLSGQMLKLPGTFLPPAWQRRCHRSGCIFTCSSSIRPAGLTKQRYPQIYVRIL